MRTYDPDAPLVSLHVPKCGGNSIMLLLRELFDDRFGLHYPDPLADRPPPRLDVGPGWCIHGHFDNTRGQGVADAYPGVEQYVTFLREPFDMQVSCYFYMRGLARRGEPSLDHRSPEPEPTLVEYLERRIEEPDCEPNPLDYLPLELAGDAWEEALARSFVYVGITEDLRTSAVVLAHRLGGAPRWLGHVNASPRDEEVPERLREPYRRAHPRQVALYEWARRTYSDRDVLRRPIARPRLESEELEYRCRLCAGYVGCSATGRPRDCDGGSRFRPLSRPAPGVVSAWLDVAAQAAGTEAARELAARIGRCDDLWIGPSLGWRPDPVVLQLAFCRQDTQSVDPDLMRRVLGERAGGLVAGLARCEAAGAARVLCGVAAPGTGPLEAHLLARLEPGATWQVLTGEPGSHELPDAPYLAELYPDGRVLLHVRHRSPPAVPLLDAIGPTQGASVVFALTPGACRPVAVEVSLVRSRLDWHALAGPLFAAGLDIGAYNRLESSFHLAEGALTVPIGESGHPTVLHYRVLGQLAARNPSL